MFHEEKKKVELSVDQFLCYYINGECNKMKPFNMFEMKKKKKIPDVRGKDDGRAYAMLSQSYRLPPSNRIKI